MPTLCARRTRIPVAVLAALTIAVPARARANAFLHSSRAETSAHGLPAEGRPRLTTSPPDSARSTAATAGADPQADKTQERRYTLLTALATAGLALTGVLGSQVIAARTALRQKRLDLWFVRKADAYLALVEAMNALDATPADPAAAGTLNRQAHRASLFASPAVRTALFGPHGLVAAAAMRGPTPTGGIAAAGTPNPGSRASPADPAPTPARSAWVAAFEQTLDAMQRDIGPSPR